MALCLRTLIAPPTSRCRKFRANPPLPTPEWRNSHRSDSDVWLLAYAPGAQAYPYASAQTACRYVGRSLARTVLFLAVA
jgi:hypothetical protein